MDKSIKTFIRRFLPLTFLAFTFIACGSNDEPSSNKKGDSISRSIEITQAERDASRQSNVFAWNLLQECVELQKGNEDNVVLSPLSANICMSMLANATAGNSQEQILRALGFSDRGLDDVNSLNRKLAAEICGLDDNVTLSLANSFWYAPVINPKKAFISDLMDNYAIESFTINPQTFVSEVNRWCSDKTKGLIPRILNEGEDGDFALLNALYFKGLWHSDYRFDKDKTFREEFHNSDATKSMVYFMNKKDIYQYHQSELWSAMRIPFGGGGFNFTVILPNQNSSVDECMASIKEFEPATGNFSNSTLILKLPKLSLKHSQDLEEVFQRMGMSDILDPDLADFSNMTDCNMFVNLIRQNVSFELDESGAEAAAVTIVVGDMAASFPQEVTAIPFYVDRPFIFMISERSTGAILFMGRVNKL